MQHSHQVQFVPNIVFIEPHAKFYKVLQTHLDCLHYNNTGFKNYLKALEYMKNNPPALIICEKHLPDMNDVINYTLLKRFAELKNIPIIHVANDIDENKLGIKVDGSIVKFSNSQILNAKIRSTLNAL